MVNDESQLMESQAQPDTQSTQHASQPVNNAIDAHLWGFLQPCNASLARIDFWKINPTYRIGRDNKLNDVVLPGYKVSNTHCRITWDGKDDRTSAVTITDLSSNGTFINGARIGKGLTSILREGNEVAFGVSYPQPQNGGLEDYRFVYRHTAAGPATEGLHAYYDISSELGKGSFATVMKAVSRVTGEWYAVKMIHDTNLKMFKTAEGPAAAAAAAAANVNNPNVNNRTSFAREIAILEKLKHPNICQLKEVFFQDGNINLVLELVEGGDLLDYILARNGLAENEARHITYQICDALAYIHSKGIAHRDLKPENVLLTNSVPPIVKVADFGLAKVVDSLTMLKTMCGTPSYLAPEVVLQSNQEGYHHVVDSWSVGVIVFSMLTNVSPFIEDDTQRDLRTRIAERTIDWTTLEATNVSPEARSFIRRLLEPQPLLRMTLSAARAHPWLQSCRPIYTEAQRRAMTRSPSPETLSQNASMISAIDDESFLSPRREGDDAGVSQSLRQMQLDHENDMVEQGDLAMADPSSSSTHHQPGNGIQREGSRTAPLRRRSLVLSQAAEGEGGVVPEPSWEMIHNAALYGRVDAGPSGNGNTGRGNKRMHSELTPLPEEMEEEAVPMNNNPLCDANGAAAVVSSPARKKGKAKEEEEEEEEDVLPVTGASTSRGGRGKGRNSTTGAPPSLRGLRTRTGAAQKEDAMNEDDPAAGAAAAPKPRRSSRQTPQKAARRV